VTSLEGVELVQNLLVESSYTPNPNTGV